MTCKICNQKTKEIFQAKILNKYEIKYFHCEHCSFLQTEDPYWLGILGAVYGPISIGFSIILVVLFIPFNFVVTTWFELIFYFAITMLATLSILLFLELSIFGPDERLSLLKKFIVSIPSLYNKRR